MNLQEGNPMTLHPHLGVDLRSRCLILALNEPLIRRDAEGVLNPAAAESYEINPAQTTYTFHIRSHKWSNGQPVTSHHFANAWKYALDPKSPSIRADLFYPIKNGEKVKKGELPLEALKIATPDDKTLIVELEHPIPYFLDLAATSFYSPLYDASNNEPSIFNGPFIVGIWINDQSLSFLKNSSYWDSTNVHLDEIAFTMVKDPMTALVMFEKGKLDVIGDPFSTLPLDSIPSLMKSGKLKSKLISGIFYLLLNTNMPHLQNKTLRKALSVSIDRDSLTKHLMVGKIPAYTHMPKPLSTLNENDASLYKQHAFALFNQALAEMGMKQGDFPKIIINYANLSGQKSFAEFIQEQWRKNLGIKVELVCTDWNIHLSLLRKKDYQVGTIQLTTLYQDPMFYMELFRNKKNVSNYSGWENENYRSLLEKSEKTIDPDDRYLFLQQAERLLLDEMPVIPIYTNNLQYLVRKGVDLFVLDTGTYDFKSTRLQVQEPSLAGVK